jgi:hypothetical protein
VIDMIDLLRALPLDQEIRKVVDGVYWSAQSLKSMLDNLLDLARLETGRLELNERRFVVRDLIEQVIDPFQQEARRKGILLLAALAPDAPQALIGDPDRMHQIIMSLVENSIKSTDHGEVVVTVERAPDGPVLITVSDTGLGLDERDPDRGCAAGARAGTGERLPRVPGWVWRSRLVSRMGHHRVVTPGQGTRFTPPSAPEAEQPTEAPMIQECPAVWCWPRPSGPRRPDRLLTAGGARASHQCPQPDGCRTRRTGCRGRPERHPGRPGC